MLIERIDPADDRAFRAWHDVYLRARRAEYPDGPYWRCRDLQGIYADDEQYDNRLWLAEEDGGAVGAAVLALPVRDNLELGEPELYVRPERWRHGIGSALLDTVLTDAKEWGRSTVMIFLDGPPTLAETSGTHFVERHGFTRRLTEVCRAQRAPFDLEELDRIVREAHSHARDYRVNRWTGPAPDDYVRGLARLEERLSIDAPLGTLDYEPEVWDPRRIRAHEQRHARMGRRAWNAVATAPDGTLAGYTQISVPTSGSGEGVQEATIVDPAHRGHRLGLLLKAANIAALVTDRPDLSVVWTWNAESNRHMIAVNEQLGYRVAGWSAGYQRTI